MFLRKERTPCWENSSSETHFRLSSRSYIVHFLAVMTTSQLLGCRRTERTILNELFSSEERHGESVPFLLTVTINTLDNWKKNN
jgi:hypothetical protein